MKKIFTTLLFLGLLQTVCAQYTQYSLYRFAEPRINPANLGLTNYASFGALYRSQQSQPGVKINSAYIQASYPFLRRKGAWSAIGVEVSSDREGLSGIFQTNQVGVQYGYHIPINKTQRLALGGSLHYFSRSVDVSELFTGSQFVTGVGFDPGIDQGEGFGDFNASYMSLGLGAKWQVVDKKSMPKTFIGAAFFHLNKPKEEFVSTTERLPVNMVFEVGQQVYTRKYSKLYLEALIWQVQSNTSLNTGLVTWIDLQKFDSRMRGQGLNIFLRYLLNEGAMVGWQWDNQIFSFGMSYDIPLFATAAHEGAFEMGVKLRSPVKAKSKRKKRRKKSTQSRRLTKPVRRASSEDEDALAIVSRKEEAESVAVSDTTQVAASDSLQLTEDKLIVHFGFEFGDTEPVIEDEYILDQVLDRMDQDSLLRIEIVGHTDDVGPSRFNQRLSELRARAIFEILFDLGADESRMTSLGRGEDEPLLPNDTEENRAENRRVEIVFIDQDE